MSNLVNCFYFHQLVFYNEKKITNCDNLLKKYKIFNERNLFFLFLMVVKIILVDQLPNKWKDNQNKWKDLVRWFRINCIWITSHNYFQLGVFIAPVLLFESRLYYTRIQCLNYGIIKSNDFKRFTDPYTILNLV